MPWPNSPSSTGEPRGTGNDPLDYHGVPNYSNPPQQSQSMADNTKEEYGWQCVACKYVQSFSRECKKCRGTEFLKYFPKLDQSPTPVSEGKDDDLKWEIIAFANAWELYSDRRQELILKLEEIIEPLKKENETLEKYVCEQGAERDAWKEEAERLIAILKRGETKELAKEWEKLNII